MNSGNENGSWNVLLNLFDNFPFRFIISAVIGAIVYFITPTDWALVIKFGAVWYIVFISLIVFLLLSFVIWIIEAIKKKLETRYKLEKTFEDLKEDLFGITDYFNDTELNIIKTIVASGNEPYKAAETEKRCFKRELFDLGFPKYKKVGNDWYFWLDKTFYTLAKVVQDGCGKISRFDKGDKNNG